MKDIKPVIPQEEKEDVLDIGHYRNMINLFSQIAASCGFFGESKDKYNAPDNSVEICKEEFDLVSRVDSKWAKSFAEKNPDEDFKYLGVLNVKSGSFPVFQNGKNMVSINPVAKLHGLQLRYYLVVKVVNKSLRDKIVLEEKQC